ncbi:WD domain protein [Aspergillus clavatus NRRL 1]|uniref:WD domain protein n=1 Tax=Aspergillus clavatus (strain ATCC 1007 / CBS 513.65 / DSM 816 / NCTC 3887 / NRRL 1 / QM 1276 / 107) TaxID=344612 RepID=A1CQQ4_ASPCL|nr:WD domain protein [Aspergillus clavatus NRRL 1]EAW07975.1 WD domain protein [Aspergillus clavatus NRRL 1]
MLKRRFDEESLDFPQPKRTHIILSSDTVSFIVPKSLTSFFRVSRRFHALAGDSELWKRKYYSRWVGPRARRIANVRRIKALASKAEYSPQVSKWLGHAHLADEGRMTNWKKQYRLRHNWSKGTCRVTEVEFPQPVRPPLLAEFCAGFIFTVDAEFGIRCRLASNPSSCVAGLPLSDSGSKTSMNPTALAVTCSVLQNMVQIAVGFENGDFSVYDMDITTSRLKLRLSHAGSADGGIIAMASSIPYVLMVSQQKVLSLYEIGSSAELANPGKLDGPNSSTMESAAGVHLVVSLKADSILSPISLSIRVAGLGIIASIVYSFLHIGCGWSLGIQELHFNENGQQVRSRLATTVDSQYGAILLPKRGHGPAPFTESMGDELYERSAEPSISHHEPPTSISYSHPYLLTSHADNTLTVYLVVSTGARLYVHGGQRLWGHTSSVSAVQVSDRGKAISVSSHGGEIRVWELETLIMSIGSSRALLAENSIQISPENKPWRKHRRFSPSKNIPSCGLDQSRVSSAEMSQGLGRMRGCIGFDDERVLLLWEKDVGTQLLELYDFT